MSTMNERLREARLKAGFSSARSAAMTFGWSPSTYAAHENGQNEMNVDAAQKYARAFKSTWGWLLTGESTAPASRSVVAVMGKIGAGAEIDAGIEQVPPEGYYEIETGVTLPIGSIAFEVVGDSMYPRFDPGDIIICPRDGTPFSDIPSKAEAAVLTGDGKRYLKKLYRTERENVFDLVSHNAEIMRSVPLVWASIIMVIIPASQWTRVSEAERQRLYREASKVKRLG